MAFYKISKFFNPEGRNDVKYYGCDWKQEKDGMYADVPDYAVEDYISAGRIEGVVAQKAPEAPKLKDVKPEDMSAEDVVTGNTVAAAEKKEARVAKAAAVKPKAKSKSKSKGK